ncbi:hypothetical protein ACFLQL_00445 [Verrucomicrobiota bacterium]
MKNKPITQFDRITCKMLSKAVETALTSVGEKHGVDIKYKSGSFTASNYIIKIEAAIINKDGTINTKEVEDFKRLCKWYNLEKSDLGKKFTTITGDTYKITGLSGRRGKYPIFAENIKSHKTYKFPPREVQQALGRKLTPIYD